MVPAWNLLGEDERVDTLIGKCGYEGTPKIMQLMEQHQDLQDNLSAVTHLIHRSS